MAAQPVDLQLVGHPVQDIEPPGVQATQNESAHHSQVAAALQQPGCGGQVARAGSGIAERAGVLVDAHEHQAGLIWCQLDAATDQLLDQQGRGRASRRIDQSLGRYQIVGAAGVVIVDHQLDLRPRGQPIRHHPEPLRLTDVAEDDPSQPGGVNLLLTKLAQFDEAAVQHATHRLLPRAGEEQFGIGV